MTRHIEQVNNLKLRWDKGYEKVQVVAPDGRVLEEFDSPNPSAAIAKAHFWADDNKDFLACNKPMTEKEFSKKLEMIFKRTNKEVYDLLVVARKTNKLPLVSEEPIPWLYSFEYNGERQADQFAELSGYIYDVLAGLLETKASRRKKLRKALGYTYP